MVDLKIKDGPKMRNLSREEISALEQRGCSAEQWDRIHVAPLFTVSQLRNVRFAGDVEIEDEVVITDSFVRNYHIGRGTVIDSVSRLECRHESMFGNGTDVRTVNECGGRKVRIFNSMSAQFAYLMAMYRHLPQLQDRLLRIADTEAAAVRSSMGTIGRNCSLISANIIREVNMADGSAVDGASCLENGTLLSGARIGADVKARNFIAAENSTIDFGAILENCFIGESSEVINGFTAVNTLAFSNCDLENGEASAVFLGPYTVSHHKSSLLIAGYFAFFNGGSGTNQSNHLFKEGAVHQSVHLRGCKFASNGYVMSPAREGAFSMVMGRNVKHHDTVNMPFSYLIENGGTTTLLPGIALYSYGTARDIAKWPKRDSRTVFRDLINYEEYTPYLAWYVRKGIEDLRRLKEEYPDAEKFSYNGTVVMPSMAERGIAVYERYLKAALAVMLRNKGTKHVGLEKWADVAGQYVPMSEIESIVGRIESGALATASQIDSVFRRAAAAYGENSYGWAYALLTEMLGHEPADSEIEDACTEGRAILDSFDAFRASDRKRDHSREMSVGYGIDGDRDTVEADFKNVRDLN